MEGLAGQIFDLRHEERRARLVELRGSRWPNRRDTGRLHRERLDALLAKPEE